MKFFLPMFFAILMVAPFGTASVQDKAPVDTAREDTAQPGAAKPEAPPIPETVARVGDQIITGDAFLRALHYRLTRLRMERGADYKPGPGFQRDTLMELIESAILRMLAQESGLTVDRAKVQEEFDRGREGFASDEDYTVYLENMGTDEGQLLEDIRARLLKEAYIEQETADITLTEAELRAQYEKVREQGAVYRRTKTLDFIHFFVRVRGTDIADWGAARERIESIRERIVAGESMEDLAREFSDDPRSAPRGGMYYEVRKEDAPEPLVDTLFSLPLGEVSEPIRSNTGWHLVKVVALHNPGIISFEQLEPMLRHGLINAKKSARIARLVAEARARIPVEIYAADGTPVPLPPPAEKEEPDATAEKDGS